jgi:AcrR family transcriptional regulator
MVKKAESTKERILDAALELFSTEGFTGTSMRTIAKAVGINAGSIYNHFESKEDILHSLYDFYSRQHAKALPDLDELLKLAETRPPSEILEKLAYDYPEDVSEKISRVFMIAARRVTIDPFSVEFIEKNLFEDADGLIVPVIRRMIELERIEPIDVESFADILTCHSFYAATYNNTPFKMKLESWRLSRRLILSLVRPR